jgi:Ca2+-binding EF-hand superfamily protein
MKIIAYLMILCLFNVLSAEQISNLHINDAENNNNEKFLDKMHRIILQKINFKQNSKLRKLDENFDEINAFFNHGDTDGDGMLSRDEFKFSLISIGVTYDDACAVIQECYAEIDLDGSGMISMNELINWAVKN